MQTLVSNIFKSMAEDEQLSLNYNTNGFNPSRPSFYRATSQPIKMTSLPQGEIGLKQNAQFYINALLESYLIHSSFTIRIIEANAVNNTVKVEIEGQWRAFTRKGDIKSQPWFYTSKTMMKVSSLYAKVIYPAKMAFIEANDVEWDVAATKSKANELLKNLANAISQKDYWVYFTKYDVPTHYIKLRDTQTLNSCMSYEAYDFGNKYHDKFVHPLECYQYAPDFRLALISPLNPDEIKEATHYPFVARVIVFRGDDHPIAFSRCYGDERAERVLSKYFEYMEKPIGRQFYALLCDSQVIDADTQTTEQLQEYYDENKRTGHLIAPFFDAYSNAFWYISKHLERLDKERHGMLMEIVRSEDCDSDDSYETLGIYFDDAVVRVHRNDGEIRSTFARLPDGLFKHGGEEF